jgi:hypothetical protein
MRGILQENPGINSKYGGNFLATARRESVEHASKKSF